jgi:hypothetical protein
MAKARAFVWRMFRDGWHFIPAILIAIFDTGKFFWLTGGFWRTLI